MVRIVFELDFFPTTTWFIGQEYFQDVLERKCRVFSTEELMALDIVYCFAPDELREFEDIYLFDSAWNDIGIKKEGIPKDIRKFVEDVIFEPYTIILYDHKALLELFCEKASNSEMAQTVADILEDYLFEPIMPIINVVRNYLKRVAGGFRFRVDEERKHVLVEIPSWLRYITSPRECHVGVSGPGVYTQFRYGSDGWPGLFGIELESLELILHKPKNSMTKIGIREPDYYISVDVLYENKELCFQIYSMRARYGATESIKFLDVNKVEVVTSEWLIDEILKKCRESLEYVKSKIHEKNYPSCIRELLTQLSIDEIIKYIREAINSSGVETEYGGFIDLSDQEFMFTFYLLNKGLFKEFFNIFKSCAILTCNILNKKLG